MPKGIRPHLSAALLTLGLGLLSGSGAVLAETSDNVVGWVEKVTVEPWGVEVKAKLDSGALTSSLDARDIKLFEKDDQEWVRFRLRLDDEDSDETLSVNLERPLYRDLTVRGAGGRDERPVVLLEVCVGDTRYEEQFSLRDREEMHYPMLLGRRTIGHLGLLSVNETFLTEASCDEDSPLMAHVAEEEGAEDDVSAQDKADDDVSAEDKADDDVDAEDKADDESA
ncbi:ATP-dependent zinc protease [Halomonas halocynthiae]|uniref:retropepsin-like aspartic peptidase RloA3 n=1 Tax=Halomonas halocynthiae TaxID=176290 RepID=UPI00041773F4|nr:RimK/LysX family protein [Halomonas halocynthiae]